MGGFLSTRWGGVSTRWTTAEFPSVTAADVCRAARLKPGDTLAGVDGWPVDVAWEPCRFGGARPWLLCPRCGDRRSRLYRGRGSVACRKCFALAYPSQNTSPCDRALAKAEAIRRRLGGEPNVWAIFPGKPPRMHWRTYARLEREHAAACRRAAETAPRFGRAFLAGL